jgi:transcription elongation factor B subunit 1
MADPSKYVTLISSDGFEFVILREAACVSGAIKRMLDPQSEYIEACKHDFGRLMNASNR